MKYPIILLVLFILLCFIAYKVVFSNRTGVKLLEFENTFVKNVRKNQLDLCSPKYKRRNVSEFYVASSHLPFLTGFKQYDYTSYEMLMKTIKYGARYIELEIYNKEMKNYTIPVVASGNSQNSLDANKCFGIIAKYAFSEKYIDNYQDPFFIFLDFKTDGNHRTLDKLYDIIRNTMRHKLLNETFSFEKKNIATTDMCQLMNRIVIFSNSSVEKNKSRIRELINMSTESSYFRRIRYDQLPLREELARPKDYPEVSITSTRISFNTNIVTLADDDVSFIDSGINKTLVIKIIGSKKNDTFDRLLQLKQVTHNQLVFDSSVVFNMELYGENVQLKAFNRSYVLKNLHNENKNSITVVYSEYDFFAMNFNPHDAWRLGCQFVCMNYQYIDANLRTYMKKMQDFSVILKPTNLINYIPKAAVANLGSLYPKYQGQELPIIMDFLDRFHNIYMVPALTEQMRIIKDKYTMKLSPNYNNNNSIFQLVEGLDGKYGSISFMHGDEYLTSNDSCCYLKFGKFEDTGSERENASFYPIEPLCGDDKYTSFLQVKGEKKYYLKYRKKFNYKNKLYSRRTNDYKLITSISSENGILNIWEAINNNNYKSIGHVGTKSLDKPTTDTILLKGAVESPIDFKLIWKDVSGTTIWKPIPPDGYLALGVVFNNSTLKPMRSKYVCVAIEYAEEVDVGEMVWKNVGYTTNNKVSLWNSPDLNYIIATPSFNRPSSFDNPVYNITTDDKDYMDRLYLGKVESDELDSSCFKVYSEEEGTGILTRHDLSGVISNKENYQIISKKVEDMNIQCIGIKNSYWSHYYTGAEAEAEAEAEALLMDADNNDQFSSNWSLFKGDGGMISIRLQGNPEYCLTAENTDKLVVKKYSEATKNKQLFGYQTENRQNTKLFQINGATKELKCVANIGGKLKLETCDTKKDEHIWSINQEPQFLCLTKGKVVYIKTKSRRGKTKYTGNSTDYTNSNNFLKEFYDRDYFHYYLKGLIEDETETEWKIKMYGNLGYRTIKKIGGNIVLNTIPYNSQVRKGIKVLCKSGGFVKQGYNETNMLWEATVLESLPNDKYNVIFTINSVEANMNRQSLGRPRKNQSRIIDLSEMILLKLIGKC